jgi:hypothetical protein
MQKYLIVTGFFNINRENWNTIFKRSLNQYFENAKRILSTPEDMIIFSSKENMDFILSNRDSNLVTYIIETNYSDLKYYKYEDKIKEIMLSDYFNSNTVFDNDNVPEFNNPEYLVVIWSKINLMKIAIEKFPEYNHFAWLDFGLHPHIIPDNYPPFYPQGINSDLVKIHCRSLPLSSDSEFDNFLSKSNNRFCAGSITGNKENIILFEDLLDIEISELLTKNIVHCEQSLFVLVYLKNKNLFELSFGNEWFGILRNYYSNIIQEKKIEI